MKEKKDKRTRRGFLAMLAALAASSKAAAQAGSDESGEKIKMLTPDGKLVEVDKAVLDKATKRQKATNKDILEWRETPKTRK